jgi:hypothetical protein
MRFILQPAGSVLTWLLRKDAAPRIVPTLPGDEENGLVVAYLLNGLCYAEVLTDKAQVRAVCGSGLPLGRLFFHVKKNDLISVCAQLSEKTFGG